MRRAGHVQIISDGTSTNTRVLVDGKQLMGVTKIVIHPIEAKPFAVSAEITVQAAWLDLVVTDTKHHGEE
jgi:hypothetical protein